MPYTLLKSRRAKARGMVEGLLEVKMLVNCLECGYPFYFEEVAHMKMKHCTQCGALIDPKEWKKEKERIEKLKSTICDHYCKYSGNYDEPCNNCPLDRLGG